jgi:hypothetical protein
MERNDRERRETDRRETAGGRRSLMNKERKTRIKCL